jgi:hypothetical protein
MSEDETDGEETYEGELNDGERHGQGTLTSADGDKYVGEFENDERGLTRLLMGENTSANGWILNKKAKSWWQNLTD